MSADFLIHEAESVLKRYGLLAEEVALSLVKVATELIWNHANPETDEKWVHWITDKEIHIKGMILALHKQRIEQRLSV